MTDKWSNLTYPISIEPDLEGKSGKAWLCNLSVGRKILNVSDDQDASIVHWVVEASWAHPAWHSYSVFCQHLRPMDGYDKQVKFHLEGATHEMIVFALDPGKDREGLIKTGIVEGIWMSSANFAAQFIALSDDMALAKIRSAVQEIVDGKLSPDTDFRQMWIERFGGNMVRDS